tara:strand:- start:4123 stop:4695 length:573 start_codon:yes stop_codon:yes gene_type:complete
MNRIAIVGQIGSGKSYVAKLLGFPIFDADLEVNKIYKKNYNCFSKIKKKIPKFIKSFPIEKKEILTSILNDQRNLKIITKIVHPIVHKKMLNFVKKNKNKKAIVLDIPLYFENKINKKKDIIIFVDAKKNKIKKRLKKRKNFNRKLFNKFNNIQLPIDYKKKKSHYVIKNDFTKRTVLKYVRNILDKIKK